MSSTLKYGWIITILVVVLIGIISFDAYWNTQQASEIDVEISRIEALTKSLKSDNCIITDLAVDYFVDGRITQSSSMGVGCRCPVVIEGLEFMSTGVLPDELCGKQKQPEKYHQHKKPVEQDSFKSHSL